MAKPVIGDPEGRVPRGSLYPGQDSLGTVLEEVQLEATDAEPLEVDKQSVLSLVVAHAHCTQVSHSLNIISQYNLFKL